MPVFKRRIACLLTALFAGQTQAGPTGVQVAGGSAAFAQHGNLLTVTNSPGAILNWQKFSIDAGETVRFVQQNAQSAVLNRVVGKDPSAILGSLQSNGRVFLVNPNGIVFGHGARIDVAGLVASSLDIADADFVAGRLNFSGNAASRTVRNDSNISTPDGGLVYLIAPDVSNAGIVTAPNGDILLAAGHTVSIAPAASPDVRVRIAAPAAGNAINVGELVARSGAVGIYGANVVQGGSIDASRAVAGADGRIYLKAERTLTARAGSRTVADGGNVTLTSGEATVVEKDAGVRADDGRIKVWSDHDTFAHGNLRAHRGFIETSGKYLDISDIAIDAPRGTWLLDPTDITISTNTGNDCALVGGMCSVSGATSTINGATIAALLSAGTDVTIDTASAGGNTGKITVAGTITMNAAAASTTSTLTMNADADIDFYWLSGAISATTGKLNVALNANRSSSGAGVKDINSGATIDTNGGYFTASGNGFTMSGGTINTHGGAISITANSATANGYGVGLSWGTLESGGGKISLASNNGITFGGGMTLNAGSGFISLNPIASGIANNGNGAIGGTMIASGLELLGGAGANFTSPSGAYIRAPGAVQSATALTGNPTVTLAGDFGSLSSFYLNRAASGNSWASDLVVGTMVGMTVSGINAHGGNVLLGTYNGNILQTAPITNVNLLNVNSMAGTPDGSSIALTNAGNSITTLSASAYDYPSGAAPTTPVLKFVNGGALSVSYAYSGKGALDIRTTTGNLTIPAGSYVRSDYSGTAGNIVNAIVLAAGTTTPAYFVSQNTNGYLAGYAGAVLDNSYGTYSRFLVYSKDVTGTSLGAYTYTTANRRFETYYGAAFYNPGSATPTSTDIPTTNNHGSYNTYGNAFVFQTAPTLTVTANAASRNYGDANPIFTYSTSGLVMSDTIGVALTGTLSSAATTASGAGSYAIDGGLSSPTGYSLGFTGGSLTVSPRPVSVTADAVTKTYGGTDPPFTYSVTGGNLVNSDVLSLTRAAGENVGNYAISLGNNPNYSVTYTGNNLGITAAVLVVVPAPEPAPAPPPSVSAGIAGNPTKTYDGTTAATLDSGNFALSGFVGGDSATVTKTTGTYDSPDAGSRTVTVSLASNDFAAGAGTVLGNYILPSSASGSGTIAHAPLTVTANDAARTYDGRVFAGGNGVRFSGFVNGETEAVLGGALAYGGSAQGAVNAGAYAIRPSGLTAGNYAIAYGNGQLAIDPVPLTVTANDAAKTYDGLAFSGGNGARFSGFVNGETQAVLGGAPAYGGSAQGATNAGTYAIRPSGLTSGNYAITYVDGQLAVTSAALTVTANDAAKTYDGLAFGGGNGVRFSGFVNGETEAALGGVLAYGGSAQGAVNAGTYAIRPSGLMSNNYAISYADGTLVVNEMTSEHVGSLLGDTLRTTVSAGTASTTTSSPSSTDSGKASPGSEKTPPAKRKENSKNASSPKPSC